MKIQYLNGGLANQIFQYIFVRYAELTNPQDEPWFFDDSFFFVNHVHNGYELEKVFGLKLNLLSQNFEPDVWNEFIENKKNGCSIPQSFKNLGFDMIMITEFENYKEHNPFDGQIYHVPGNTFLPDITALKEEFIYYHGYWLHPNYFNTYQDVFKRELAFPPIMDERNLAYANHILSSQSVAIHIRRGDYINLGWASSIEYYHSKTTEILARTPDATFFIFSDDIPWCKENCDALGFTLPHETVFVEGNIQGKNYIDLKLMSMCKIMLIGRSAFSYLAMLMNNNLEYFIFDETGR